MTIDEALLYLERDDASIRFFSPQDYEAFVTLKKYAKSQQQPCEDCISREAVIKHICESKECYKDECKGRLYKRCFDLQWIYDLPSVTPQQTRWIPVTERLPVLTGKYLVTVKNGNVYAAVFDSWSGRFQCAATAWMSLPEPYQSND